MSEMIDREATVKQICKMGEMVGGHDRDVAISIALFVQDDKTAFPTITIPVAELDTTNDFAEWIDVNGDGSIMKCSRCGEEVCCKNNNFCSNCGASMSANDRQVTGKLKEGEEKKSCLNCGSSECELGNRERYGFCGNWTMKEGGENE